MVFTDKEFISEELKRFLIRHLGSKRIREIGKELTGKETLYLVVYRSRRFRKEHHEEALIELTKQAVKNLNENYEEDSRVIKDFVIPLERRRRFGGTLLGGLERTFDKLLNSLSCT